PQQVPPRLEQGAAPRNDAGRWEKAMEPIELGRMRVHKVHEMDSPVPLLSQLPGATAADLARLRRWYDQPDEITADPATSFMTFSVHSWVIEIDGRVILIDTCDGNHKNRSLEAVHRLDT